MRRGRMSVRLAFPRPRPTRVHAYSTIRSNQRICRGRVPTIRTTRGYDAEREHAVMNGALRTAVDTVGSELFTIVHKPSSASELTH